MVHSTGASPPYDTLLVRGSLIDGTGHRAYEADIAIKGDRIAAIGELRGARAAEEIDVQGKCLAPGFIDTHTHDDQACMSAATMEPKVSQGVTTVVVGNCGVSLAPLDHPSAVPEPINLLGEPKDFRFRDFSSYFDAVDAARPSTNVVALVGHSSLRVAAMPNLERPAQRKELDSMIGMLEEAMRSGAGGLSTGVFYPPGRAADSAEVVPLVRKAGEHGGIYATHMRNEHDDVLDSMREVFEAAREGGAPLLISHHKCAGARNWGRSRETLALLDCVRETQDVSLDLYPYDAGSSVLDLDLLEDGMRVLITWSIPHPSASGKYLHDIAREWGCSEREAGRALKPAGACYFFISEEDVRRIIQHPAAMIGSDGLPMDRHPHPRLWGTFPRVIRRYAMEYGLFSVEEAIRKMTSLPAHRFGLHDRGVLAVGNYADLVIFDPVTVADRATYENPTEAAQGIDHVFVNGCLSWSEMHGLPTGYGRLLRRGTVESG
ncbi:MAG: D-aminoacylase [Gammaproteobacteria bacterium]|nr:D-aminoacylase [Gammaproteobacteria bacterium]